MLTKKKENRTNFGGGVGAVVAPLLSRNSQRFSQTYNFVDFMKMKNTKDGNTSKSNLNTISDESNMSLKEGYLVLQESETYSGKKQWKRFYFVVRNDGMSYYSTNSKTEEKGKINTNNCVVKRGDSLTTKPNSFIIKCEDQSQYSFYADDEDKCQDWISYFESSTH